MRTTLQIDDDVLAAARSLARANAESVGAALSALARRGLRAAPRAGEGGLEGGFPTFLVPAGARVITLEDVRRGEDEP
jgi:hypothetical protein